MRRGGQGQGGEEGRRVATAAVLRGGGTPVKTLPRPVYDGDKSALVDPCGCLGSGAVDEARDLIARGINIDEQNDYNTTALMKAAQYNRLEIVQALIRAGAALNLQEKNGNTALIYAIWNFRPEIAQELIRAGAALNLQENENGYTALMYAAAYNYLEFAQELIRAGAVLDVQDNQGRTALQIARSQGHTKLSALLEKAEAAGSVGEAGECQ